MDLQTYEEFVKNSIIWLGHDSFIIKGSKKLIYIDPYQISTNNSKYKADIILLTHDHYDHTSVEDVNKIKSDTTVIVGPADSVAKFKGNTKTIIPNQKIKLDDIELQAVPAYNTNKKFHPKSNNWVGYIITVDGIKVYHAGDTDRIPEMKNITTDIALLPVSGTYVMTAEEAVEAALDINPKIAIPMHYGSIVGSETDAFKFRDNLKNKIHVIILKPIK